MIYNKTKKSQISSDLLVCKSFFSLGRGLVFRKLKAHQALMLNLPTEGKASIHTFFVFYPIDVVWMNKDMKVVDLRRGVKPFSVYVAPKEKAKYVLELPAGKIKSLNVEKGDDISLYKIQNK